jgi:3-phenylpropionate/cinnamic acid dioxygenase small subunit
VDTHTIPKRVGLDQAMAFVWLEADLLDHCLYDEWLALWTRGGRYVVPVDPTATDFENTLNYAYDDHDMRLKRIDRLVSGKSISASPVARTVRMLSRFRLLDSAEGPDYCDLRCAQMLTEFRRGRERVHTADVTFRLVAEPAGLRIDQKVVRLINTEALSGIGYIL